MTISEVYLRLSSHYIIVHICRKNKSYPRIIFQRIWNTPSAREGAARWNSCKLIHHALYVGVEGRPRAAANSRNDRKCITDSARRPSDGAACVCVAPRIHPWPFSTWTTLPRLVHGEPTSRVMAEPARSAVSTNVRVKRAWRRFLHRLLML